MPRCSSADTHNLMQRGVLKLAEHAPEAGALAGHGVRMGFVGTTVGMGVKAAAHKLVGKSWPSGCRETHPETAVGNHRKRIIVAGWGFGPF